MPTEIIFPRVDMDMTSGQISRWYFNDGDKIEKGKPLTAKQFVSLKKVVGLLKFKASENPQEDRQLTLAL